MKHLFLLLALGAACSQGHAQTSKEAATARNWAAACFNCHGTDGNAQPGMEPLAGMPKDDITKKMLDFKAGRKPATIMHQLSKGYSDEQIAAIAGYFAAQPKPAK
jgi:sulfide dehydrogenase cytochrome subunit